MVLSVFYEYAVIYDISNVRIYIYKNINTPVCDQIWTSVHLKGKAIPKRTSERMHTELQMNMDMMFGGQNKHR